MSDIPRYDLSKYPSKAGLCQIYRVTTNPNIRQRLGCVRYTESLPIQISVKGLVVSDIKRHHPSKYPSKPGLCQIYHATIRPNIRQRRVVSDIPSDLSVKNGVVSDIPHHHPSTYPSKAGCVRYTTPLFVHISVEGGFSQIYNATIRPNIRQRRAESDIPRHYLSKYPSKAGCVRYTMHPDNRPISVKGSGVSDIPRHYSSKYPSKAGLGLIYQATFRPNTRQRRACVRYTNVPRHHPSN